MKKIVILLFLILIVLIAGGIMITKKNNSNKQEDLNQDTISQRSYDLIKTLKKDSTIQDSTFVLPANTHKITIPSN